jgi:hypothetical protein
MKKQHAMKFWRELQDSTEIDEVIARYKNRSGYASERTLQRYAQASKGFREDVPMEELSKKTGWGIPYLQRMRMW